MIYKLFIFIELPPAHFSPVSSFCWTFGESNLHRKQIKQFQIKLLRRVNKVHKSETIITFP